MWSAYCISSTGVEGREAQATTSPAEYFAELSTAYLCDDNKWEPFNRAQLLRRDPEACALLRRIWDEGDSLGGAPVGRRRGRRLFELIRRLRR